MLWARLLAYGTGTVNQELLLRNEYLAAENRILRGQVKGWAAAFGRRKGDTDRDRSPVGRMALENVAATAKPDTILGWYRKLIANKFDGSKFRRSVGRPKVDQETERLVVQMARENPSWGYDCLDLTKRLRSDRLSVYLIRRWVTSSVATALIEKA
jgi:putative transposase